MLTGKGRRAAVADDAALESFGAAQEVERRTTQTKPRTIQIDDKFEGAVVIKVWPNYAVKVVNSKGEATVIAGPRTVILEYDEDLQAMSLSTGKPKNTDTLLRTVFLQATNNQVGDIVHVQTSDLVDVAFRVSLRINFEGDPQKWYDVDNYVKFITDRVRSMLKNMAKQVGIEVLNARYVELVRDCILGTEKGEDGERRGRVFRENGARITDVEVLGIKIGDEDISEMLTQAQHTSVSDAISIAAAERRLEVTRRNQVVAQTEAGLRAQTAAKQAELDRAELERTSELNLARIGAAEAEGARQMEAKLLAERGAKTVQDASLARDLEKRVHERDQKHADELKRLDVKQAELELHLRALQSEAEATIKQAGAVTPQLIAAMQQLGDSIQIAGLTESMSPVAIIQQLIGSGEGGVKDLAQKLLKGTGLIDAVDRMGKRD
jgi:major vault protein